MFFFLGAGDMLCEANVRYCDTTAAEEEEELKRMPIIIPPTIPWRRWREDDRDARLLGPILNWEHKVVLVLDMVRSRELTECNPKCSNLALPTRFCGWYNMAFFDLDKESEIERGPLFREIPTTPYWGLDDSINVISIKVVESGVPFPIYVYGTVLARDCNDYRCVYFFKRDRNNPQLITSPDDPLALTGPRRALGGLDRTFFEFHLKIKGEGPVGKDFSKGLIEWNAVCATHTLSRSLSLGSCQSEVSMLFAHVCSALEASLELNVLNGKPNFTGKVAAWTAGNGNSKIVLYDNQVAGTVTTLASGGSVPLTRRIVSVQHNENLMLEFSVCESGRLKLAVGPRDVKERRLQIGPYQLQLKIVWTGVTRRHRPNMLVHINDTAVLWGYEDIKIKIILLQRC